MSKKEDTLVKVVLVFFIGLLSFSFGSYVGKVVSDNDHRQAQVQMDNWCAKARAETQCESCPVCPQVEERKQKIHFKLVEE